MIVSELIKKLQNFPPDMQVCISDENMGEGGTPYFEVTKQLASEAGLDGDDCCGYLYNYPDDEEEIQKCLDVGMIKVDDDLYSFEVIMLTAI